MPAEWQPHAGCWMAWPCNESIWPNGMDSARLNFAAVVRAILEVEAATLAVRADLRRGRRWKAGRRELAIQRLGEVSARAGPARRRLRARSPRPALHGRAAGAGRGRHPCRR